MRSPLMIEDGRLDLSTTARSVLGQDLPLIGDDVTIEHLLSHRSGIGDYLDEEVDLELTDYLLPVSVHELATTEQYLTVLDGHPRKFAPAERFGLGIWLHASTDTVVLEGCDAGVSFRSEHDPRADVTCTVISNTSDGAWPIARYLSERHARGRGLAT